ncbi:membrane protein [Dyadobacter frigoris]|uniref:PepSY-associated TM helix domain-containing protein n=1 Tax=Dyadobacter frigoris TaxID=2576211 RepID=UPI0024A59B6C|nr:PepSY-associated TM helix domain-containing protein [Dyadobacter frigoris]GLU52743.1 membrane protein [Dyadobacter frigoris]
MKKLSAVIHLWLGMVSGLIVFIVSISGCIFVFEQEIFDLNHSELVYSEGSSGKVKPLSELLVTAQTALSKTMPVSDVEIFSDPDRSYIFTASKTDKKAKNTWNYFQQVKYYQEVYINPYTGACLGVVDRKYEFFNIVRRIHQNLLLSYEVGSLIVGSSCLMFLGLLITGFVLWIPKTKNGWKQRFTIKWNAKWRRLNYDTHNVGGFYVLAPAMIIVITGLVWSFDWWEDGIYTLLGSKQRPTFNIEQPKLAKLSKPAENLLDKVFHAASSKKLSFERLAISLPEKSTNPYRVFMGLSRGAGWSSSNYYYYHGMSGQQYGQLLQEDKSLGQKWRNTNYDIHTGGVYGKLTKILAFLASLFCATLPVTGYFIWLGKRKKSQKTMTKVPRQANSNEMRKKPQLINSKTVQDS